MKYEVKKEFLLTADENEMEMQATAVKNQIRAMAKEYAGGAQIWSYSNPPEEFIEVTASSWFGLLSSLCEAIGTVKWANEYDFTIEVVHRIFEQDKKDREELDEKNRLLLP